MGNDYPFPTCLNFVFFFLVDNSIVGVGGIDVAIENTRSWQLSYRGFLCCCSGGFRSFFDRWLGVLFP